MASTLGLAVSQQSHVPTCGGEDGTNTTSTLEPFQSNKGITPTKKRYMLASRKKKGTRTKGKAQKQAHEGARLLDMRV